MPVAVQALQRVPGQRALEAVLADARGLQVHLQPIVELASGRVWGVEALARFPGHPEPGPADWFGAALRDGCGTALELVALGRALELLPLLPPDLRLTVNLSGAALLLPAVSSLLLDRGDSRLLVELTEHEQVEDYPALGAVLAALADAGIGLCIDDFGAGHSSLRHVLHLQPDVVKLDLALVQGVAACSRRQALVRAMMTFCASTGTMLVAEGVEDADDLARLCELGVDHAQGWHLWRPAPAADVLRDLRRRLVVLP